MIIEMCRYDLCCHIIGRMLYRRKGVDLFSDRQHNDTARMLSCGTSYTYTAFRNTFHFRTALCDLMFFTIFLNVAICGLFRHCTNRSGTKSLTCTKNNLRIIACITLILIWEVQVDIRLFVSLKSQECFKRNIMTFFVHYCPTIRTDLIWKIARRSSRIFLDHRIIKVIMMAGWTIIMCRQRIDLRNSGHRCRKGWSNWASGTNQVSIFVRLPHQLLCNNIHHGISVTNDRF